MIAALDPGINGCGLAIFDGKELHLARYVKNPDAHKEMKAQRVLGMAGAVCDILAKVAKFPKAVDKLVTECPQIYVQEIHKSDPNDLIPLAQIAAAIAMWGHPDTLWVQYLPRQWKGQILKEVMTERIQNALSLDELQRVEKIGALDHNTFDAVGIGLYCVGRPISQKVYPRG